MGSSCIVTRNPIEFKRHEGIELLWIYQTGRMCANKLTVKSSKNQTILLNIIINVWDYPQKMCNFALLKSTR